MRILFTGGGMGGHFFPILATIRELKRIAEEGQIINLELFYMGPNEFGERLLEEEGVLSIKITTGKIRRYFSLMNILDLFKIPVGIFQALWNIFLIMPDVIFSKGGYGSFPAVAVAILFKIPLIIHESDAMPGRVNLLAARYAKRIGIAFKNASKIFPEDKTALLGVPIRKRIFGGDKDRAKENLDIFSNSPVIGITGASQGSKRINEAVLEILKDLTDEYELVHQTGENHYKDVLGQADVILGSGHRERYHPFGFFDENKMRDFFSVCDLVVSRASASTIFEIAAWGKPSILIPLTDSAQDHQRKNAYEYASEGGAVVIEEANLSPHILFSEIKKIINDPGLMRQMSLAAQGFSRIDSAEIVAREILKLGIHPARYN